MRGDVETAVWRQLGTFPSLGHIIVSGVRHRPDHPAVGWDDGGHFSKAGPTVQYCAVGRPEPLVLRRDCPVSSRGREPSPRSDLPPGWREKSAALAAARSPRGGYSRGVADFSGPGRKYWARHLMWSGEDVPRWTWTLLDAAWYYALDGGPTVCVRPPWPRSGPGRVGPPLCSPEDDGGLEWDQWLGTDPPQCVSPSTECSHQGNEKTLSTSSSGWEIYLPPTSVPRL